MLDLWRSNSFFIVMKRFWESPGWRWFRMRDGNEKGLDKMSRENYSRDLECRRQIRVIEADRERIPPPVKLCREYRGAKLFSRKKFLSPQLSPSSECKFPPPSQSSRKFDSNRWNIGDNYPYFVGHVVNKRRKIRFERKYRKVRKLNKHHEHWTFIEPSCWIDLSIKWIWGQNDLMTFFFDILRDFQFNGPRILVNVKLNFAIFLLLSHLRKKILRAINFIYFHLPIQDVSTINPNSQYELHPIG